MTTTLAASPPSPVGDGPRPAAARRVVLVDPRPERRAITCALVERCADLTVVGLAAGLDDAVPQIRSELADVALVEIQMPVAVGLTTVAALREQFPGLRIVICSFRDDPTTRDEARAHGADGYLGKPLLIAELVSLALAPGHRSDPVASVVTRQQP